MIGLGDLPAGQEFSWGYDVSDDGSVVVGNGINPDELTEVWLATLQVVEPGIPGDLTGDGAIGVADLLILISNWG